MDLQRRRAAFIDYVELLRELNGDLSALAGEIRARPAHALGLLGLALYQVLSTMSQDPDPNS
jgi:hypothetical protein